MGKYTHSEIQEREKGIYRNIDRYIVVLCVRVSVCRQIEKESQTERSYRYRGERAAIIEKYNIDINRVREGLVREMIRSINI